MKKKPLVSIIVPVYLVSDYLYRCIKSLVDQNYFYLEIILVDDGSPDNCAIMCDEWAKKDARIKVIHKKNGGLSDARNYGMLLASGEYVSFVDSDDFVSDDFIEVLITTALERSSDIVECSHINYYENGDYKEFQDDLDIHVFMTPEGLLALIDDNLLHQHVWNKIYKREIVQDIYFEVGKQHEDEFWTYQVFGQAERITKINRTMYFYLQRESSIMGRGYNLQRLDALEGRWNRLLYIEKHFPELRSHAKLSFFGSCMNTMQCAIKYMSGNEKRQAIRIIRKYKKMSRLNFKDIQAVHNGARKYFYLAKINIFLCCAMRAGLNIGF